MNIPQASLPPAMMLRDSFGDRKIPDISPRVSASVDCRKQKVSAKGSLVDEDDNQYQSIELCRPDAR